MNAHAVSINIAGTLGRGPDQPAMKNCFELRAGSYI